MSLPLIIRHTNDIVPVKCPRGDSKRILTSQDNPEISVHRTEFRNAKAHLHKRTTGIYYILQGKGSIILDGQRKDLSPGIVVQIPPGTVHRVDGEVTALVVCRPAFDPADEFMSDGESYRG